MQDDIMNNISLSKSSKVGYSPAFYFNAARAPQSFDLQKGYHPIYKFNKIIIPHAPIPVNDPYPYVVQKYNYWS